MASALDQVAVSPRETALTMMGVSASSAVRVLTSALSAAVLMP
jgi:hypothetical protein